MLVVYSGPRLRVGLDFYVCSSHRPTTRKVLIHGRPQVINIGPNKRPNFTNLPCDRVYTIYCSRVSVIQRFNHVEKAGSLHKSRGDSRQ